MCFEILDSPLGILLIKHLETICTCCEKTQLEHSTSQRNAHNLFFKIENSLKSSYYVEKHVRCLFV